MAEGQLYSVEILRDHDGQWRRLAPLPAPLQNPGVEYFRERVFVLGGTATVLWLIPTIIMSNPPGSDHISQWTCLNQRTRYPTPAAFVTASRNRLFLFGKCLVCLKVKRMYPSTVLPIVDFPLPLRNGPFCGCHPVQHGRGARFCRQYGEYLHAIRKKCFDLPSVRM